MKTRVSSNQISNRALSLVTVLGLAAALLALNGCVATRSWVSERLTALSGRISNVETRQDETDTKIENLRLVSKLVLSVDQGMNYSVGSSSLNEGAEREIDRFLINLSGDSYSEIVIAGHTDSTGTETYNYELGKRRAESVAGYLISHGGIDPAKIKTVSYGESAPIDENVSSAGRSRNRRVEILVYKQQITYTRQEVILRKRSS